VDVPPPDVEALPFRPFGPVGAGRLQIVEAAEEQRGAAEVGQRLDAFLDLPLQDLGVDPVRGDVADVEGLGVRPHRAQGGAGRGEVGALPGQGVVVGRRGRGGRCGRRGLRRLRRLRRLR
jgi:hypothetical protein